MTEDQSFPYKDFILYGQGFPGPPSPSTVLDVEELKFDTLFEVDSSIGDLVEHYSDMYPPIPQASQPHHNNIAEKEKARLASLRISTPDSEALASSDDETNDLPNISASVISERSTNKQNARRTSWLDQIRSGPPRRASNASNTSPLNLLAPSEQFVPLGRTISNQSFATNTSTSPLHMLNTSEQRQMLAFASSPRNNADDRFGPPGVRSFRDNSVPFSFPLQPVQKAHRSMSYSVGQTDESLTSDDQVDVQDGEKVSSYQTGSNRLPRYNTLGQVIEGDNASYMGNGNLGSAHSGNATNGGGRRFSNAPANRPYEMPGGILVSPQDNVSLPKSPPIFNPFTHTFGLTHLNQLASHVPHPLNGEAGDLAGAGLGREFATHDLLAGLAGLGTSQPDAAPRRSQYKTSLDFGPLPDIPQSRRHSMAEMPTRRNSLAAAAANDQAVFSPLASTAGSSLVIVDPDQGVEALDSPQMQNRDDQGRGFAAGYFSGHGPAARSHYEMNQQVMAPNPQGGNYHQGPPQGVFQRPGPDTNRLVLVSFKCARTEVYYLAENTGLQVSMGDLVIVEADRGYDLGTVLQLNLTFDEARRLKDEANNTHLHWLTMFSQHNQGVGVASSPSGGMMANSQYNTTPLAMTIHQQASAQAEPQNGSYGQHYTSPNGMSNPQSNGGPSNGIHGPDNSGNNKQAELKPRLIKRLAQPHEVASLREKEGNEAKAKRLCQQKVQELGLDMEILDAEFQVDWKKLTFFYYSNKYINFNTLVTDLFKIYKTRIWLSAVNPASLNIPNTAPRAIPGAVESRHEPFDPRRGMARQYDGPPYNDPTANTPASGYQPSANYSSYAMTPRSSGFAPAPAPAFGGRYRDGRGGFQAMMDLGMSLPAVPYQHGAGPIARPPGAGAFSPGGKS